MPAAELQDEYHLQKVCGTPAGTETSTRRAQEQERHSLACLRPEKSLHKIT